MVTGLLASVLPAWQAAKADPSDSMRTISTKAATRAASRLQWTLVSLQVSLSLICAIACGLLVSSYLTLLSVDRGFQGQDVIATSLNVTHIQYRNPTSRIALAEQLVERVREIPGVRAAGVASRLPLNGGVGGTVLTVEGTNLPVVERPMVAILGADSRYFGTMGIPLHQGRIFAAADRGRHVAVVAASVAQRAWPGQDPIGRRFRLGPGSSGSAIEVVGVVGDIRGLSLTAGPTLDVYLPYWQSDTSLDNDQVSLVLRTEGDDARSLSQVRAVITALDPEMPFSSFRTMEEIAHASVRERRVAMNAMMFVAAAVMLLASVGIYGLVSYTAAQRTMEIGVRLALGAQAWDIRRFVMRDAVAHVGIGLLVGLLATVPLTALVRTVVFGVGPRDPFTIVVALAVLSAVAAVAIYIPTRRAANRCALTALRCE
jgi:putative ABC transport system permease protein